MKRLIFGVMILMVMMGCRREDIREMTVHMPSLKESDKELIVKTLSRYKGVDLKSFVWDMDAKTLTLKYDSMDVAQSNIRYAIDNRVVRVKFPVKEGDHAGY